MAPKCCVIAACCLGNGIGMNNRLPWNLKTEMEYFTRITTTLRHDVSETGDTDVKQNAVIMGRRTYLSIPPRFRPLKKRINAVLSSSVTEQLAGVSHMFTNLADAVYVLSCMPNVDRIFVIGGEQVYREAIDHPEMIEYVFLTRINAHFDCDRHFPVLSPDRYMQVTDDQILKEFEIPLGVQQEGDLSFEYTLYRPIE